MAQDGSGGMWPQGVMPGMAPGMMQYPMMGMGE